jgi:phenylalanyl-tRNA synthetase alpha chain
MLETLGRIESDGLLELAAVADAAALEAWRIRYLGANGSLKAAMGEMKAVSKADKPAVGKRMNEVKKALETAFASRGEELKAGGGGVGSGGGGGGGGGGGKLGEVDMTEPGLIESHHIGRRHIISRVREELVEVFARMGFSVATGPELEDDDHNFVRLNIPADHPARDPIDNFYVDDPATTAVPRMLRSQTSTVQIRVMDAAVADGGGPPIKVISPGRVYRPDTVDATHTFMFHQLEGLYIDRGVSMVDLKSTLLNFARAYFGEDADVRLRPSFFPFTEPSAEFDMKIALKEGDEPDWIELGGCGMVDPAVLSAAGIDPEKWTGFAFGFGIERLAMGKYGIPDIRLLFENDLRFLQQL